MRSKLMLAVAAAAVLSVAFVVPGDAAKKKKKPGVQTIQIIGAEVNIPPNGGPVRAYAFCPKGYRVAGGGTVNGALISAFQSPSGEEAWVASYFNPSSADTFRGSVTAVCIRGKGGLKVTRASSRKLARAERQMKARLAE